MCEKSGPFMRKTTGPRQRGVMGRWSIFRPKVNSKDHRYQGIVTKEGRHAFELSRRELGALYRNIMGRDAVNVSDADTIEFLARGPLETRNYLKAAKRLEDHDART